MKKEIVKLEKIVKKYNNDIILNKLDLTVYENDVIYIKGANGSGKSTLLKIIAKLLDIDDGEFKIDNDLNIGALIENPNFADYSNIYENLEFLYNLKSKMNYQKVAELCSRFSLDLKDKRIIKKYSIGMKQKMGIIQAIMEDQKLILLDEPTRGLDKESVDVFRDLMIELINQNKTIIIAAHDFVDIGYSKMFELKYGVLSEV